MEIDNSFPLAGDVLFGELREMLVITGLDLRILHTNPFFIKYTGYSPEEIAGKKFSSFLQNGGIDSLKEKINDKNFLEIKFRAKKFTFESEIRFSRSGHYFIAIIRDITADRSAQENFIKAAFRWRETFDLMRDSVCQVDNSGKIIRCNRNFAELAGKEINQMIGCPLQEILTVFNDEKFNGYLISALQYKKRQYYEKDINEHSYGISIDPCFDELGKPSCSIIIMNDITDRIAALRALEESESRLKLALEGSNETLWDLDFKAHIFFSPDLYVKLGFDPAATPVDFDYLKSLIHPEDLDNVNFKFMQLAASKDGFLELECRLKTIKGEWQWYMIRGKMIGSIEAGKSVHATGTMSEITYKKNLELNLKESEEKFRVIFDQAAVGIARVNLDGRFLEVNEVFRCITGFDREEILNATLWDITYPDDIAQSESKLKDLISCKIDLFEQEKRYLRKDKTVIWCHVSNGVVRNSKHKPLYLISVINDITERKKAEEEIIRSLREKEVLLKEIHHRVKNNLNIVTSLLELKKETLTNSEAIDAINDSISRMRSMAIIHEKLYSSEDLGKIFIKEYLMELGNILLSNYDASGDIELALEAEKISMDINFMIPFGLIINEMMTNSIKYAFKGIRGGKISVKVYIEEAGSLVVEFCDNGVGIPPSIDIRKPRTLVLEIINDLTRQLKGSFELIPGKGACYIYKFPLKTGIKTYQI